MFEDEVAVLDREGTVTTLLGERGLVLEAIGAGVANVVLLRGEKTSVVRVTVDAMSEERMRALKAERDAETERQADALLGLSTAGLVRRGSLGVRASQFPSGWSHREHLSLKGSAGDWNHRLDFSQERFFFGGRPPVVFYDPSLSIRGPSLGITLGSAAQQSEFGGTLARRVDVTARLGSQSITASIAGPLDGRTPLFSMEAARLGVRRDFDGSSLTAGLTLGGFGGPPLILPSVGVGFIMGQAKLELAAGVEASSITPLSAFVLGGSAELAGGGCFASANGGARGGTARLVGFVPSMPVWFSAKANCSVGLHGLQVSASRLEFMRGISILRANYRVGHVNRNLAVDVSTTNSQDSGLTTASVNGVLGLPSDATVQAWAGITKASASELYWQRIGLTLSAPPYQMSISATLHETLVGVQSAQGAIAARYSSGGGRVQASLSLLPMVLTPGSPIYVFNGAANLRFVPSPTYSFEASLQYDALTGNVAARGGFEWRFGDELPRDPLMRLLQSKTVRIEAYEDSNANEERDPEELPISGVRVCVEEKCDLTDAGGFVSIGDLTAGEHAATADPSTVIGRIPEFIGFRSFMVGGYSTPLVRFPFRAGAVIPVVVYVDQNDNGAKDVDEPIMPNVRVVIEGCAKGQGMSARDGRLNLIAERTGNCRLQVDAITLPVGFLANGVARMSFELERLETRTVALGVRPVRSVRGTVCLDKNMNSRCESSESGLAGVQVKLGRLYATTDNAGAFGFSLVPSGPQLLYVASGETPSGWVQGSTKTLTLPLTPTNVDNVSIAFQSTGLNTDQREILADWPGLGQVPAIERSRTSFAIGDLSLFETPMSAEDAAKRVEAAIPTKLIKQVTGATKKGMKLFVGVAMPVVADRGAQPRAQAFALALGKWLVKQSGLSVSDVVIEIEPPSGQVAIVTARACELKGKAE